MTERMWEASPDADIGSRSGDLSHLRGEKK